MGSLRDGLALSVSTTALLVLVGIAGSTADAHTRWVSCGGLTGRTYSAQKVTIVGLIVLR